MGSKAIRFKNKNNDYIYPCPYFPVGSIYISTISTNPSTYFGGKWEQIKDRFLLSAGNTYKAGNTGGSSSHNHTLNSAAAMIGSPNGNANGLGFTASQNGDLSSSTYSVGNSNSATTNGHPNRSHNTKLTGTTDSANHIPPYLVVYVWKRVS